MMGRGQGSMLAGLLLLLCACTAPAAANLNMSALCLTVPDGMFVSSQMDCSSYYHCQGATASLMSCSNGQYFNKDTQTCVASSQSTCASKSHPCLGKTVGSFQPDSSSCGGYWYCGDSGAIYGSCPTGENFNPTTMACVYAYQYACSQSVVDSSSGASPGVEVALNLCSLIENGFYFGSASDCSGWNYCQDNVLHSGTCQNGLVFNVNGKSCGYRSPSSCAQVTNDPSLTGAVAPTTCTTSGTMKNATACNQYYLCTGSSYTLMTCGSGLYFDTVSQTCVARMQARNDCDRCLGSTKSFVNAYSSSGCNQYLYCVNGAQKAVETCPDNYYFNEDAGSCVYETEPAFKCCNPDGLSGQPATTAAKTTTTATTTTTTATTKTPA
ncbi:peritrophin-48 [Drosophila guanche]|uniref:Blast:Peritrophin-48 n=1 Tax=Drosophila guanche TaxID=7266 RepID=A0A3B0KLL4_DROGU|nr:peritrophin-48 [Drosophila guanche]SPP84708.1 blast:Peritrophin-48 [Drosophila guanche]